MLERLIFSAENEKKYLILFSELFAVFLIMSLFNYFLGGNYIFLVALSALSVSYPITKFIRRLDHEELFKHSIADTILLFKRQILVFWLIFISSTLTFLLTFNLLKDTSFHQLVITSLSGFMINPNLTFTEILLNNLFVGFLGFGVAFISTSGLVFLIIWNASLLAYVVQNISELPFYISLLGYLSHGLLEIAGFVLLGLAGSLISYRLERFSRFDRSANKFLLRNFILLIVFGIFLITIGAFFEVL